MAETQHKIRLLFTADANNLLLSVSNLLKLVSAKYLKDKMSAS
jgi:hypothetical protein